MIEKLLKPRPKTFYYGRVIDTAPEVKKVRVRLASGLTLWVDAGGLAPAIDDPLVIAGIEGDQARFVVQEVGGIIPQTGTVITV